MKFQVISKSGVKGNDVLIVFVFEGEKRIASGKWQELETQLAKVLDRHSKEGFSGKEQDYVKTHLDSQLFSGELVIVGLGKRDDFGIERQRRAVANAVSKLKGIKYKSAIVLLPDANEPIMLSGLAQAAVEGIVLASYRFNKYKTNGNNHKNIYLESVGIVALTPAEEGKIRTGVSKGELYSRATCFARDLVNEPASVMTPRKLAEVAKSISKRGISIKIFDEGQIKKMGMGGLLGVSIGSAEPPRFVHLTYKSPGAKKTVAIIGKAITFDSGGLCIKTGEGMLTMKDDMSGAAAVLGMFSVLAELKPKVNVHGIFAAAENMPGGRAYKTGDILKAMNGKTMEIINTDAEGRLTLADALSYASKLEPDEIIDMATLTGACVVALGPDIAGIFSKSDRLTNKVVEASKFSGEPIWQMPLPDDYFEMIKSEVADVKNAGQRWGGAITAALFLREFVDSKIPWAHIDIAGPCFVAEEKPYQPYKLAGGTGVMVRTMLRYLEMQN
ncbi:MAG: hypothetical protein A2W23_00445 [Planctomycetes bacterium RBG_16_43_13]|nr:MAG: hypothetical protein A2W23_00445 [Planctomycetes bacterium RBG_16_43_13]